MALLTDENQQRLTALLVEDKLVAADAMQAYIKKAQEKGKPLLTQLLDDGAVDNEVLTRCIAKVSGVP